MKSSSISLATSDSCPWCLSQETAPVDILKGDFDAGSIDLGLCIECASPLALDTEKSQVRRTRRITERNVRDILPHDDWLKFEEAQTKIRNLPQSTRQALIQKLRDL